MRMSRVRLCQNKNNNNNTSFVSERLREARESNAREATCAKSTGKMTVKPPASSRVLTERRAIPPSDTRSHKVIPMDCDQNGELYEERILFVCVCARKRTEVMSSMRISSAQKRKRKQADKQVLLILILILILIFIFILVGRRGINSCILHSQKCVRCEMFEKRQHQQQQVQGLCRLQRR